MLWIVIEEVCPQLQSAYVALFSNSSNTIGWVKHLAERGFVGIDAFSESISATIKKFWGITVDAFAHFWG